jgi:hypothetical protein
MDCIQAQSIVSEAMDRQPLPPALLAEAKEHCRTCPECAVFVRAQLAAKKAPLPTPPADLADRVMAQVRAEAGEKAAALAATEEQEREAQAAAEAAAAEPTPPPVSLAPPSKRKRQLPRMWVSAAAAAAMLVALLGTGAVVIFGMKAMSGGTSTEAPRSFEMNTEQSTTYGADGTSESPAGSADLAAVPRKASGPQFITVNGTVYSWSRTDDIGVATLTKLGATTTSLGGRGQTISRTVYIGRSPDTVYVVDDEDAVQAFVRVTRDYRGQTYVLISAELTGYGQWPTLPTTISTPASSDGLPTFVPGAADSSGVQTFKPAVASGVNGIAIAPSTDTGLMENNPNWTWWIPAR